MYLSCKWTNPLFDFFGTGCLIFPLIFLLCARFHCRFYFFCLSRSFALCNLSACVRYDRYNCVANNYCNIGLDYGLLVNCLFARNSNACNDYKITRETFAQLRTFSIFCYIPYIPFIVRGAPFVYLYRSIVLLFVERCAVSCLPSMW